MHYLDAMCFDSAIERMISRGHTLSIVVFLPILCSSWVAWLEYQMRGQMSSGLAPEYFVLQRIKHGAHQNAESFIFQEYLTRRK